MGEIHNPRVIGDLELTQAPSDPKHAVRLQDLDARVQPLKAFVSDITTSNGIVASKVYAPTVPANKVLQSAVTDTENVRVHVLAQGGLFEVPEVTVNGTAAGNWTPSSDNLFAGYADISVEESGTITVQSSTGYTSTVNLTVATEGPAISQATIGALPGTQTEAKQGDVVAVTGIVANDAVSIAVKVAGAAQSGTVTGFGASDSAGAGFKTFTGTFTVGSGTGAQVVTVIAKNALGTEGAETASLNTIVLNQTKPTIGAISVNYPNGQSALRNGDVAQASSTITDADVVNYAFSAAGQTVAIQDPDSYTVSKDITLTSGTYSVANNYTITATKSSNGAVSTRTGSIKIANSEATAAISVQGNPTKLRTDADGETYTLVVTPSQTLNAAPNLTLAVGAWVGSWTQAGNNWTRTFKVADSDARGAAAVTGKVTNLSNLQSDVTGSFTIGGLIERTITFPAFARFAAIGAAVSDITKTRARYNGQSTDLARRGDTTDVAASFTIVNENGLYDPNGGYLFLSDAAFAGANTSGTLQVLFEETL